MAHCGRIAVRTSSPLTDTSMHPTSSEATLPAKLDYTSSIDHIRFGLVDICVRGDWRDISLFRFVNRAAFMLRQPAYFVIFRPDSSSEVLRSVHLSTNDPNYAPALRHATSSLLLDSDGRVDWSRCAPYAIRVFSTDIYFLVFVHRTDFSTHSYHALDYVPCSSSSSIHRFFSDCFAPLGPVLQNSGLNEHLLRRIDELYDANTPLAAPHDHPDTLPFTDPTLQELVGLAYDRMLDTLYSSLSTIENAALLRPQPFSIPNFLCSVKVFTRNSARVGTYFFNFKLVLTPTQRFALALHLSTIARRGAYDPYPDALIDDWFWSEARKAAGIEHIFAIFTSAPSPGTTLFLDAALMSGTIQVHNNFSQEFILGHFDSSYLPADANRCAAREAALRRFCVLHYFLQFMAPDAQSRSLLTFPIRVSGSTWMAITTVVGDTHESCSAIVDHAEFQRRFLLYHSVMRNVENRIRQRMRNTYLKFCGDRFCTILSKSLAEQVRQRRQEWTSQRKKAVNAPDRVGDRFIARHHAFGLSDSDVRLAWQRSIAACRVFPFPPILFVRKEHVLECRAMSAREINLECAIWLVMPTSNPFFDRLRMKAFLQEDEVAETLGPIIGRTVRSHMSDH